jgi:hypothetical protein
LRCIGHIFNLIAEQYLFGQDAKSYEEEWKKAGAPERRQLWRRRGELGKLHNLVAHVMASGKRTELFLQLQGDLNTGVAEGKRWRLVLDGGIRWNSSYMMIRRGLELREALDTYALQLHVSKDAFDRETAENDYLHDDEWKTLEVIRDQLEPLFRLTKDLEGNPDLKDGAMKASHGALWEVLPVLEHILQHFEDLESQANAGAFGDNPRIQQSITLAWNKTNEYYQRTDASIAWIGSVVLHPRWKWSYFDTHWTGPLRPFIFPAQKKLKSLFERDYKKDSPGSHLEKSPEPAKRPSYLESILDNLAPISAQVPRPGSRRDELFLYLEEPVIGHMGVMEYWRSREQQWPNLARMAFDFLAIPAMSSECERVFSSCAKLTTPESSKLSGDMLWHQECLKNWQRRGAIVMATAWNSVLLDLD